MLTLAAVVGLNGADVAAISATADNLEKAFGFGNTGIGMLVSVVALAGAVFTVPAGILTDRTRRTRLLAVSIVLWSAAMLASGAATSFTWLIAARAFLGAGLATAGPAVASLTGDFFPAQLRGRIYSLILAGGPGWHRGRVPGVRRHRQRAVVAVRLLVARAARRRACLGSVEPAPPGWSTPS